MAFGLTGVNAHDLAATTDTTIYTCPTGKTAVINVRFANRTAAAVTVRLAIVESGGTLAANHYLEYDANVAANGILEDTALVLSTGDFVVARASVTGVSVRVHGFEE